MIAFAAQFGMMLAVTAAAGLTCASVAFGFVGVLGVQAAGVAALVSVPTGLLMLEVLRRFGSTTEAILLATFLRMGLTLGAGALVASAVPSFWGAPFFLSLATIYLANLTLETWLVYEQNRRSSVSSST